MGQISIRSTRWEESPGQTQNTLTLRITLRCADRGRSQIASTHNCDRARPCALAEDASCSCRPVGFRRCSVDSPDGMVQGEEGEKKSSFLISRGSPFGEASKARLGIGHAKKARAWYGLFALSLA